MRRRDFAAGLLLTAAGPLEGSAQLSSKPRLVGVLARARPRVTPRGPIKICCTAGVIHT